MLFTIVLLLLFGFLIGGVLGLTGAGGSILSVPLLVYGASIPLRDAFIISLIVVAIIAFIGAVQRTLAKEVDYPAALITVLTGMCGAPLGTSVSYALSDRTLMIGFGILMIIVGLLMRRPLKSSTEKESQRKTTVHWAVLSGGGLLAGFFSGLFGVGGGFFIVPLLIFAADLTIKRAMATSLLVIALVSLTAAVSHLHMQENSFSIKVLLLFLSGGALGMFTGIIISKKIRSGTLQKGFAIMTICVGCVILIGNAIKNL